MNYGKTAYLKILDIEKEMNSINSENNYNNKFLEITKPNIDQTYNLENNLNIEFPNINVFSGNTICFQIKLTISTLHEGENNFELIVNDCIIHQETKYVSKGETDVLIIKTFKPISTGELKFSLKISTNEDSSIFTANSATVVIFGAEGKSENFDIELRALNINNHTVLISYIDDNKIYYTKQSICEKSLSMENFTQSLPAISHCFTKEKFDNNLGDENIILYRVDPNKNLYMSKIFTGESEKLIDTNISCVHACTCPSVSDELNLIAYIKEDKCFFRTTREDSIISEKSFDLPSGKYTDINVISNENSEFLYVIASNENGSNYILKSLIEVSTGKITEILNASYMLQIERYLDLSLIKDKTIENLKMKTEFLVEAINKIDQILSNIPNENIKLKYCLNLDKYEIEHVEEVEDVTYGIQLDKSAYTDSDSWASYTDEAVGFSGAYMDFDNDIFVDNGWTNRWPFNKIKPCVLKEGKLIGYLNKDNYAQFEDGTAFDNTNIENGSVYIEFPKIYYHISKDDENIYIKISSKPKDGFICKPFIYKGVEYENIYVSAYHNGTATMATTGLNIASGQQVRYGYMFGYENDYPHLSYTGNGYDFIPYNMVILIQCLFMIMFKSTNSQAKLGLGYESYLRDYYVGELDQKGMFYGKNTYGYSTKLFGIENFYCCRNTIAPGYYLDSSTMPRYIDVYDQNSSYAPEGIDSYLTSTKTFKKGSALSRVATDINEDCENIGFFHTSYNTNATYGFCDTSCNKTSTVCVLFGLNGTKDNNGLFSVTTCKANTSDLNRGVRLVYYPL